MSSDGKIKLSDLEPDYIQNQINRIKGILNSCNGKDGKPLNDEKVIALISIMIDMYNSMCYKKEEDEEKEIKEELIEKKQDFARMLADSLSEVTMYPTTARYED